MLAREHAHRGSQEMAEHFHVSRHTITNWEKSRSNPSHAEIVEWARVTDCDVEWLLDGQLDAPPVRDEELAVALVKLLRGRDSNSQPTDLSPEELLRPEEPEWIIDLRTEPARIVPIGRLASAC